MSNTNNRRISIGMKHSGEVFTIKETSIEKEEFEKFMDDLIDAMNGDKEAVSLLDENRDLLYLTFDSVAYVTIIKESK